MTRDSNPQHPRLITARKVRPNVTLPSFCTLPLELVNPFEIGGPTGSRTPTETMRTSHATAITISPSGNVEGSGTRTQSCVHLRWRFPRLCIRTTGIGCPDRVICPLSWRTKMLPICYSQVHLLSSPPNGPLDTLQHYLFSHWNGH